MNNDAMKILAAETADRLRLIQTEFVGEKEETQKEYVREHLEEVLKKVSPGEKNVFLNLLKIHFPTAIDLHCNEQKQSIASVDSVDQLSRHNPDHLISVFSSYISSLGDEEKKELAQKLFQSEMGSFAVQQDSDELIHGIQAELNIKNKTISAAHMAIQYKLLLDFINQIDHLVWKTWSTLSPKSKIHPKCNLPEVLIQYLTDNSDASFDDMAYGVIQLKRFTTAMVNAIAKVGGQFANQFLATYSPSSISSLVKLEGAGFWTSEEVRCWSKYKQLADSLTKDSIEIQIRRAMIEYIESLPNLGRV
jgi:hypothetical protein